MKYSIQIFNLTAIFTISFAMTTFLHELAHALTAVFLNIQPTLYHSYVAYDESTATDVQQLLIAAAGPLFSLMQGLFFIQLLRRRAKSDFITWLFLWMGVIGMVVFLGYIMMGPISPYGDTGKVYALVGTPAFIPFILSGAAVFGIVLFFKRITPIIGRLIFPLKQTLGYDDTMAVKRLFVFPLVIGTVLNVLLSLPAPTPLSLLLPFIISLTMIPSAIRLKTLIKPQEKKNEATTSPLKMVYWPINWLVLMLILSRILAGGITF